MPLLEICADSLRSALNAQAGGADRIELCQALPEGGLTPSVATLQLAKRHLNIPVFVLVRPRVGDFLYDAWECELIEQEIEMLRAAGADGIVVGALDEEGRVDTEKMQRILRAAAGLPLTFHRAFDLCSEPFQALQTLSALGCARVLTSGLAANVEAGKEMLKQLHAFIQAHQLPIRLLAGGGLNEQNVAELLQHTHITEVHGSLQSTVYSQMNRKPSQVQMGNGSNEWQWRETDVDRVRAVKAVLDRLG